MSEDFTAEQVDKTHAAYKLGVADGIAAERERCERRMSNPTVCCVMLVNGRPKMVKRAIAAFRAQTYAEKRLLIWDSSPALTVDHEDWPGGIRHMPAPLPIAATIGALRNEANRYALADFDTATGVKVDAIAHWDSDDWSHPRRLEEQVALLEASGKQCVGYRELLFWDTRAECTTAGEAWIYRNQDPRWAAGASFLYRRELWEQQPFENAPHEDQRWWLTPLVTRNCIGMYGATTSDGEPRMICQMHAGGTEQISRKVMADGGGGVWRRAPEWDQHCAQRMAL